MHPATVFLRVHQTGELKLLQMAGDGCAGDPQPFDNLAGAERGVVKQCLHHFQTVCVRQRFELNQFYIHV